MEEQPTPAPPAQRPRALERLCIASFIDQGVVFLIYLFGAIGIYAQRTIPREELDRQLKLLHDWLLPHMPQQQLEQAQRLVQEHGAALMLVLLARTVVRFVGTLRMWHGHKDGLHIYTGAQLLGVLAPMLVAGPVMFDLGALTCVLLWCFLYWSQRAVLR